MPCNRNSELPRPVTLGHERKQNWNGLLCSMMAKYGRPGDKIPQIHGDYRDQLWMPPLQIDEPEESYTLDEITDPNLWEENKVIGVIQKPKKKRVFKRKTKKLHKKQTQQDQNKDRDQVLESPTSDAANKENGNKEDANDDDSDVEYICEVEAPKEENFYICPTSNKKFRLNFIDIKQSCVNTTLK